MLSGALCEALWRRESRCTGDAHGGAIDLAVFQKQERSMNIFVGNLAREVTEADLRKMFEPFGHVASAAGSDGHVMLAHRFV